MVPPQALRLGNFLNETKPLNFLHSSPETRDPYVLRLGRYLNNEPAAPPAPSGPPPEPGVPVSASEPAAEPAAVAAPPPNLIDEPVGA